MTEAPQAAMAATALVAIQIDICASPDFDQFTTLRHRLLNSSHHPPTMPFAAIVSQIVCTAVVPNTRQQRRRIPPALHVSAQQQPTSETS